MQPKPPETSVCWHVLLGLSLALTAACGGDAPDAASPNGAAQAGSGAATASTESAKVALANGELLGASENGVRRFLGIPYAKPPVGELRFRRPQKPDPWSTPLEATKFGKRCAQANSAVLMNPASEDEDCLYLNVWTPNDAQKLPVMVWIHGGGNVNGSASELVPYSRPEALEYFYEGDALARKNVVIVTLNYRLGVFGFLSHPELDEPGSPSGNQGIWDQLAALEWVKDNIEELGGDPTNVTIFGESAGSYDVCLHVASPRSRGLFHRAVSQSGGCTTLTNTRQQAEATARTLASSLGCADTGVAACLRSQQVLPLLTAASSLPPTATGRTLGPTVDGDFLPDQPRNLYERGDISRVPYLLGSNTDEGSLFTAALPPISTEAEYDAALQMQFMDRGSAIKALYPLEAFADGKPTPAQAALTRIAGDSRLVCSTTDTALLAAAHAPSVYTYNFDIPVNPALTPVFLGATHGAELAYVFQTSSSFDAEQTAASELMQRYWTNFARTGDPNGGSDAAWPTYSAATDRRMNFARSASTVLDNFRKAECDLWIAGYEQTFATAAAATAATAP